MRMPSTHRAIFAIAALTVTFAFACSDEARLVTVPPEESGGELLPEEGADDLERDELDGAGGSENAGSDEARGGIGGSRDDPGENDPGGKTSREETPFTAPRGACDTSARIGGFSAEKQVDFGVVQGTVRDGVVPTAILTVVADDGRCQLLERRNLACFPGCVGMETCGESGTCIPFPREISVGEVSISGLTRETRMSPLTPGAKYLFPGADNPPYEVETQIVLSAAGDGSLPAFQLFGIGSEPLPEKPTWVLASGADLVLEWAPPTANVATTVFVELTIDQHGITPLSLACELEDTGSATIPASTIDRLITSGVTGFPNGRIMRRTADHVDVASGCVDFVVGSPLAASVSVSGFTPCEEPADCPTGQTCNYALERCE